MSSVVSCPSCSVKHKVPEDLRGKSARCRCGHIMRIPGPQAAANAGAPAQAGVSVQCPSCAKSHRAGPNLFGKTVRCQCGGTFQVSGGATQADPFASAGVGRDPLGMSAGHGDPLAMPGGGGDPFGADWNTLNQPGASLPAANYQHPYQAPAAVASRPSGGKKKKNPGRCPNCKSTKYKMPVFTWWGGFVGQRIINHVVCQKCGTAFNSKTGGSNTMVIVTYNVVAAVFVMGMLGLTVLLSALEG